MMYQDLNTVNSCSCRKWWQATDLPSRKDFEIAQTTEKKSTTLNKLIVVYAHDRRYIFYNYMNEEVEINLV